MGTGQGHSEWASWKPYYPRFCGASDRNLAFSDLRHALEALGFEVRVKGDHFIYTRHDVAEIINIQPMGNKAKAYQVKQVRNLILKYKLAR